MFICTGITPSVAVDNIEQSSMPTFNGNTLYVGGTGEGNYTKIQDAIDNANDGDTVFVYDDSSPYYENIWINESICLIGEDRNTTIIDGGDSGDVICISTHEVNVNGFTIQNGNDEGILLYNSSHSIISDNNIFNNCVGITIRYWNYFSSHYNIIKSNIITSNICDGIFIFSSDYNIIKDNTISNNGIQDRVSSGLELDSSHNNTITGNIINSNKADGMRIIESSNNNISYNNVLNNRGAGIFLFDYGYNRGNIITHNIISNNENGIEQYWLVSNTFEYNNICNNNIGLTSRYSRKNIYKANNFIKNKKHVYSLTDNSDKWISNYWDNWIGFKIKLPIFQRFPKIIFGALIVPISIDWHPAKEPYKIEDVI